MDNGERPSAGLGLSDRQRTAMAAALTILAAAVIVATVLAVGWGIAVFLRRFSAVFLPLAVGAIAALVFRPWYDWLRRRLHLPASLALIGVFLSILLPVAGFLWFFGAILVGQISDLVARMPGWWQALTEFVENRWPQVLEFLRSNPWGQRLQAAFEGHQEALVEGLQSFGGKALSLGALVMRGVGTLIGWAVLPIYFAFFLIAERARPEGGLERLLPFLKPETRKDVVYLVAEFVEIIVAFFRGQLVIAFLQGLLFAVGFSLVGLRYGFVLGLVLGLLNVIPYLGSIIGLGVGLPLAYFQEGGGLHLVGWMLVVFTLVQLIEGYVLTPRIMGDRTGLHPVAIIVAIFFWGSALEGILGMILAIPLTAFLVVFWRLANEKYIRELV